MTIDPTRYEIPNRQNLSYRQQIAYVENMIFDAENDARDVARAEAQKARERLALERDPTDPEEPDAVQEASDLADLTADAAEGAAGSEDAEEGADEVGQHAHAVAALELARRLPGAENAAGSEDAGEGIDEVEPQAPSEEAADLPHLTAAEAEEGTDPEGQEEGAEEGEPPQAEEASEPAHANAEGAAEAPVAASAYRPARLSQKERRPVRKPTKRKPAAKGTTGRAPSQSRRRSHAVIVPPPPALAPLLTAPALLRGEDPAEYDAFLARVVEEVRPEGGVEHMLVRDFVGRSWEVARYRRAKAAYLSSREGDTIWSLLHALNVETKELEGLVRGWMSGDAAAQHRVRALLAGAGWDDSVIHARSLAVSLKTLEGIDDLALRAEASRAASWAQLVRQRSDLAERDAQPQALIDAAYTEVEDKDQNSDEEGA